jgi:hypothetical protein
VISIQSNLLATDYWKPITFCLLTKFCFNVTILSEITETLTGRKLMENIVVIYHITYILISSVLTIWVGKTLQDHSGEFLTEAFAGNELMARSVNHLLIVGFYLLNFAVVSLLLRVGGAPTNAVDFIELLSLKIGGVLLLPGIVYFVTMFKLAKMRSRHVPGNPASNPHLADSRFNANGMLYEASLETTE